MFEPKTKVIDDIEFKVVPFPAIEALRLKADLIKLIGPAFALFVGSIGNVQNIMEARINGAGMSDAFKMLLEQLDTDTFIKLVKKILNSTSCQIKTGDKSVFFNFQEDSKFDLYFNEVFQGKLMTIYPLMLFVLEVNYPDFFVRAKGFGNRLQIPTSQKADETGMSNSKE